MNSRAVALTCATLTLVACATEIPRGRYLEVRAQLEKSVFEEGGVRMIIIQSPQTNGGACDSAPSQSDFH